MYRTTRPKYISRLTSNWWTTLNFFSSRNHTLLEFCSRNTNIFIYTSQLCRRKGHCPKTDKLQYCVKSIGKNPIIFGKSLRINSHHLTTLDGDTSIKIIKEILCEISRFGNIQNFSSHKRWRNFNGTLEYLISFTFASWSPTANKNIFPWNFQSLEGFWCKAGGGTKLRISSGWRQECQPGILVSWLMGSSRPSQVIVSIENSHQSVMPWHCGLLLGRAKIWENRCLRKITKNIGNIIQS